MMVEIKVPEVGESVTQGVLVSWFKDEGDMVQVDDPLFELETDKVTMTVPAQRAGQLSIHVAAGAKVTVGQVVGFLDTAADAVVATKKPGPTTAPVPPLAIPAGFPQAQAKLARDPAIAYDTLSPAVRRLVEERALDPSQISATGKGGRLTKEDVVRHLEQSGPSVLSAEKKPSTSATNQSAVFGESAPSHRPALATSLPPPRSEAPRQTRQVMSTIRQRIAERMVLAQQTAAILTSFNEADLSAVMAMRAHYRDIFQKRYGVSLGLMPFFIKATVEALKAVPVLNAQIQGDEIVTNHFYDIGIAVSTEHGLVVPVIRDADQLSFAQLQAAIETYAQRARARTLNLSDLTGGTFTISNGGRYGSLLSTPILNPPQSGILGMHTIKERPVVVEGEIVIRPMMYLALSYDHRLVDGQEAVTFLKRIVECIENPERALLEV